MTGPNGRAGSSNEPYYHQGDGEAPSNESYYRQRLSQLRQNRSDQNVSANETGRYGNVRRPRFLPLDEVRDGHVREVAKPTPKSNRRTMEDDRKHGRLVYGSAGALNLWRRLGEKAPTGPEYPELGVDVDAIVVAKRWRQIAKKSVGVSPSACYNQWRSFRRLHERIRGGFPSLEPIRRESYDSFFDYCRRRRDVRRILTGKFNREKANRENKTRDGRANAGQRGELRREEDRNGHCADDREWSDWVSRRCPAGVGLKLIWYDSLCMWRLL